MGREKIAVVNWYSVFPFNHGGSQAIRGLYLALSEWFDVTIITFDGSGLDIFREEVELSKHLKVMTFSLPEEYRALTRKYYERHGFGAGVSLDDCIPASRELHKSERLVRLVGEAARDAKLVVTEHPYSYRLIQRACGDKILWYRAQNIEYDYKTASYGKLRDPEPLLEEIREIEQECCDGVAGIWTITQGDADRFNDFYRVPRDKLLHISAGYDADAVPFVPPSERRSADPRYRASALFMSSNAPMAVPAVEKTFALAREFPSVKFIIVGGVCNRFQDRRLDENITLAGLVSEAAKMEYLKTADVALNLLDAGSGLNMKMFEYFAVGLPVIATRFGARGLDVEDGKEVIFTSPDRTGRDLAAFLGMDTADRDRLAANARNFVEKRCGWRNVAEKAVNRIRERNFFPVDEEAAAPPEELALTPRRVELFRAGKDRKVFIWGAGDFGRMCLATLMEQGVAVACFVDNDPDKWGRDVDGCAVHSPGHFFANGEGSVLIVAVSPFTIGSILSQTAGRLPPGVRIVPSAHGAIPPYYYDEAKIRRMAEPPAPKK